MELWKQILKTVAPTLATATGSPIAGMAVKFLTDNFLEDEDGTQDKLEEAIKNATPEQLTKLKELDYQFKQQMARLEIDVYKLEVEDRSSARDLFNKNIWPQIGLSSVFVVGYFAILFFMFRSSDKLGTMPEQMFGVFTTVLGVLTASVPQILGFWFGSSKGSQDKDRRGK